MKFSVPDGAWPILLTPFTQANQVDFDGIASLIHFYHGVGVPGILALGQASEVLQLSDEERFAVAEHVAKLCQGRMSAVVVGNYGATISEQVASLERVAAYGVDVAVVAVSLLPSNQNLAAQLLEIAHQTNPEVQLGIYELPEPEHRLLSPEDVHAVAQTGRYIFMKDTCRQIDPFTAKVQAAKDSPLKLFQANLKILPASMEVGASGFCGWMPMIAPELCAQVVNLTQYAPELRQQAYENLMEFQAVMVEQGFPASAKYILSQRGVAIQSFTRVKSGEKFNADGAAIIRNYLTEKNRFAPLSSV